ncbi:uncharacterized protein LOC115634094 [Scaptodrosophila lebanonensis]|uniref:Uncharacterized protein LOC115634094 n=1 Tax=Drosophila lebanonensis TaxID=7225 RepID=A0A6J2UGC7_DROLE|nr:uncharacterized protein LOC115634094 [Scaptodrosophila lebanonensis]XP_030387511.1 uncharacterized protein LOC115634094 [Scaptodrosophila lebanonensis]
MSHLLKRTKKSCLKFLRKISTSKQLFVQRLEEDDISSNCNIEPAADTCSYEGFADDAHDKQYEAQRYGKSNNNNTSSPLKTGQCFAQVQEAAAPEQQAEDVEQSEEVKLEENEENQNGHAIINGLTSKFFLGADGYEFRRLHQLRSDAASEILEWEPETDTEIECDPIYSHSQGATNVQFERVRYKQNVRYLRHTPSNSSLDLQQQVAAKPPVPNDRERQLWSVSHPCSVSFGSKFDGLYHNVVIREPPHDDYPIVKWDINGNSLDDEYLDVSTDWADFDNRWRQLQLQDRRPTHNPYSLRSSHQSSACTLETWIDDAEPLSGLFDDQPHGSLHTSGSNNNNNNKNTNSSNLCLKSF